MKKFFIYFSLSILTAMGIYSMIVMSGLQRTFDGKKTNVYELAQNPNVYDVKDSNSVSDVIVRENLDKTHALNAVTAVVFDFRGYDTLGESFILLTAISGSVAILRKGIKGREDANEEKHQG